MFFPRDFAIRLFLGVTDLRFFTRCHLAVQPGLLLHFPDMALLTFQLSCFMAGQVALMNALVDTLVLSDLCLTNGRCTNLSYTRCGQSESKQEQENVFCFHG